MKNDYFEIDGKRYRIEFNWNTIAEWMDITGHTLEDLVDMKTIKANEYTELFFQSVVEGSRMDGVEFPMSKLDFGAVLKPKAIPEFMTIFAKHMQSMTAVISSKKK